MLATFSRRRAKIVGLFLLLVWLGVIVVRCYQRQPDELFASQGQPGDLFGYSLALVDNRLAISAYGDDAGGEKAGAVYLFHKEGERWREAGKLVAHNAQPYAFFGSSIALSAETLAATVCEQQSFSRGGAIRLYSLRNGIWQPTQTIPSTGCSRSANLLAIHDNLLAVGLANARTVRLFEREGDMWQPLAVLKPTAVFYYSITDPFAHLRTVALSANRVVMGLEDGTGVFVFAKAADGTWREEQKLEAMGSSSQFGAAVAIWQNHILVGDPQVERCVAGDCVVSGAAFLFRFDGERWQEVAKLEAERPFANSWFGRSVVLGSEQILVGAPLEVAGAFGAVYHFANCNGRWQQQARLTAGSNPRTDTALSRGWEATQTLVQQRDPRPSKVWEAARGGFLHPVLLPFGPAMVVEETAVFIGTNRFVGNGSPPVYRFGLDGCRN
ncbi:MAG: hypothetical protein AAF614_23740 [Chloroflexota bacterium]